MTRRIRTARVALAPRAESLEGRELLTTRGPLAAPVPPPPIVVPAAAYAIGMVVGVDAPQVARADLVAVGKVVTGVTVTFTRPMVPGPPGDVRNYYLIDGSKHGARGNIKGMLLPLRAATYDPATSTVTLTPATKLKPSGN